MNLQGFRNEVREYSQLAGFSLKALARELNLHPSALSHKFKAANNARLTHAETRQIIKTLAHWRALTYRGEALCLLNYLGLQEDFFTRQEWDSPPLSWLETMEPPGPVKARPLPSDGSPRRADSPDKAASPVFISSAPILAPTPVAEKSALASSTASSPYHNLPFQATPLVGRAQEVKEARHLLNRADLRLLSFTGPGGIGKTQLALQVAAELLEDFSEGVFFVPLASISDPDLVPSAIARVLGLKETIKKAALELLKDYLRHKQLLLVLDNFEQVVGAGLLITELMAAAPRLKVLVTSRILLGIYGEYEFLVPPLTLPDLNRLPSFDRLGQYEAVALFLQRARAVERNFRLTSQNGPVVAEICVRLDGLPLAIELAAARLKLFSPQDLLARLRGVFGHTSLQFLASNKRDLPARQQTLRGTIDWSYQFLEQSEKILFARLAVFVGGCTLEAAEAICLGGLAMIPHNPDEVWPTEVLEGLTSLLAKSMLVKTVDENEKPRFRMLETVHEYALEKLRQGGEETRVSQQHARYYLELAEQAEPKLKGAEQVNWLARLDSEDYNLAAALNWYFEHGHNTSALRLAGALWRFYLVRGRWNEGRAWLEKALALNPLPEDREAKAARAKALNGLGVMCWEQGEPSRASALYEESLALQRELGNKQAMASCLNNLANLRGSKALHQESLALKREIGDKWGIASSLGNLANLARENGSYEEARVLYQESLAFRQELGDWHGMAQVYTNWGLLLLLQINQVGPDNPGKQNLSLEERKPARDNQIKAGENGLGGLKDLEQASWFLQESLKIKLELKDKLFLNWTIIGLAGIAQLRGNAAVAARLFGATEGIQEANNGLLSPADQQFFDLLIGATRTQLGELSFASEGAAGRALNFEQVIALAKQVT